MRVNKKKFIYLISPNKIYKKFFKDLQELLETGKISFFQLRLKKYSFKHKILIGEKIKNICKKNKVKSLINDDPILAKRLGADGCHLGQKDMNIKEIEETQKIFDHRAKMCTLAAQGKWVRELESK